MAAVTWTLTNPPPVTGAIFGLSYVGQTGRGGGNNLGRAVVITANDGGAAWTPDEGTTWFTLPGVTGFWAVAFATPKAGWLVGTEWPHLENQLLAERTSLIQKIAKQSVTLERSRGDPAKLPESYATGFLGSLGMTFMTSCLLLLRP